jgi:hypothetical protein
MINHKPFNKNTDKDIIEEIKNKNNNIFFTDNDKLNDDAFLKIKNHCWKTAETDWVIVCDADEFIHINEQELVEQEAANYNIIKAQGYTVVNRDNSIKDIHKMKYGYRDTAYDKHMLFNKKYIAEINYAHGCHPNLHMDCIVGSPNAGATKEFKIIHYKWLGREYTLKRREALRNRGVSEFNRSKMWTNDYIYSEAELNEKNYIVSLDYIYKIADLIKIID